MTYDSGYVYFLLNSKKGILSMWIQASAPALSGFGVSRVGALALFSGLMVCFPDPREDPKSRSLNGGSYKAPLVVWGPKLGDLLSRSSRGSGLGWPCSLRIVQSTDRVILQFL